MKRLLIAAIFFAVLGVGNYAQACDPTYTTTRGEILHVISGLPPGTCTISSVRPIPGDACPSLRARAEPANPRFAGRPAAGAQRWHFVCLRWNGTRWVDGPNRRD